MTIFKSTATEKAFLHRVIKLLACIIFCSACGPQEPAKIPVTGIALDRVTVTLTEGENTALVATITPADATDKTISWSSSNQAVATVTDGVINALKAGTAVITAKTNDGGITASCTVNVDIALAAITGDASHISCRNAVLAGKANVPGKTATDLTFGVLYSTSSGVLLGKATQVEATLFDADYNYSIITETLEPETTYYYRSYISQNNEIVYGDTKSFTTLPVSSMIKTEDASDIEAAVATLHASLDLSDCLYDSIEYGFQLSLEGGATTSLKAADLSDNAYSVKAEGLSREKNYEVAAYVTLDGRTYAADKKIFSTQTIQASISLYDASEISGLKATLSGKLNVESQGSFTKTATLYYSTTATTVEELKSHGATISLMLNEADGAFSKTLTNLNPGTTYHYVIIVTVDGVVFTSEVKSFTTKEYPKPVAVDMGLSVKWASFNVGAEKPEDYGAYYAWGETETKSDYSWSSYKFGTSSYGPFSKYNTKSSYGAVDNKTTLDPEDDVAHVILGGNWRMPTDAEWTELRNNCTWTWTTQNGVYGRLVTSKKTGNSIFLPAAGYCNNDNLNNAGSYGLFWSSSLNTDGPTYAWNISISSGSVLSYDNYRYLGLSVRPVCDN